MPYRNVGPAPRRYTTTQLAALVAKYGSTGTIQPNGLEPGLMVFDTTAQMTKVFDPTLGFLTTSANIAPSNLTLSTSVNSSTVAPTQRAVNELVGSRGVADIRSFGTVDLTGAVDCTTVMQLAHNSGKIIYYPAGNYTFSKVTMSSGGIIGDGEGTFLKSTDSSSADCITHTGTGSSQNQIPLFKNFQLWGPGQYAAPTKSTGYGIRFVVDPAQDTNSQFNWHMDNVHMRYWPGCVDTTRSNGWRITNCTFFFYQTTGVLVDNPGNTDAGDSLISGCYFFNGGSGYYATMGRAIVQRTSGGLRVHGNKFNGGISAYKLDLQATTSIFLFTGNSLENVTGIGLEFTNTANTVGVPFRFASIIITGNHFAGNAKDIVIAAISNYLNSSYWDQIVICGNVFYTPTSTYSISIYTARAINITGNVLNGNFIGAGGIYLDSTVSTGRVENTVMGIGTPLTNNASNVVDATVAVMPMSVNGPFGFGTSSPDATSLATFHVATDSNLDIRNSGGNMAIQVMNDNRSAYIPLLLSASQIVLGNSGGEAFRVLTNAGLQLNKLQSSSSYANDAAAATGGVAVGQLYRNGSQVMIRIA
jgi:hypothetical protein